MPVFNESENVRFAIPALAAECDGCGCSYELIVIDDGCVDDTVDVVRMLARDNPRVRLFRHRQNLGPGSGVYTGIAVARGEFVIFVPADLAMQPAEIRKFITASRDADVVNGLRSDRRDYSLFRKCMSVTNIALIRTLFGIQLRQFNYIQAYRRSIFERFYPQSMGVFITGEMLIGSRDLGMRITEVEIEYRPRLIGTTGVANWRGISRTVIDMLRFRLQYHARRQQYREGFDGLRYQRERVLPLIEPIPNDSTDGSRA